MPSATSLIVNFEKWSTPSREMWYNKMGSNIENCARVEFEGTQSEPNFLRNRLQSKTATVNKDFSLRPAVDCSFCNSIDFWICYGGIWTLMWGWELSSVCINRFTPPVLLCGFSCASTLRKEINENWTYSAALFSIAHFLVKKKLLIRGT